MSGQINEFVLTALQHMGALIEDQGFQRYDVLLPPALAEALQVGPLVTLHLDGEGEDSEEELYLSYGHPFVDGLIEHYQQHRQPGHLYVQGLRLTKEGLADLARRSLSVPKGRLNTSRGHVPHAEIFHYIQFFFWVVTLSDEKYEHLVQTTFCIQTGEPLQQQDWTYQARLQTEPDWGAGTIQAPVAWMPDATPLSESCLAALLSRAARNVPQQLSEHLDKMRRRTERHLELDQARLESYYEDLQADMNHRIARLARQPDSEKKQRDLEDKRQLLQTEREAKLLDIQQKYQLRMQVELRNIQIIEQPKLVLQMLIEKGKKHIPARVVWDPLLHRLEPPLYDSQALQAL